LNGNPSEKYDFLDCDATAIHWGFYTKEIRERHRDLWDKNYTNAIGRNPYGIWEFSIR